MLKVEVDNLSERVHLRRLEVPYELCQTVLELRVYILNVSIVHLQNKMTTHTNHGLEAVLAIDSKTGLTWQLNGIHNVDAHLDHALHHHVVFLKLWSSQQCMLNTTRTPAHIVCIYSHTCIPDALRQGRGE